MTLTLVERAEGYRVFARCLAHPHEALTATIRASNALETGIFRDLDRHFCDTSLAELEGEHNRLFAQGAIARPYETSWRRDDRGARMGQIAALYQMFGVRPTSVERVDHIAVELEFASLLAFKAATARSAEEAEVAAGARAVFVKEHLGPWVGPFCARLTECAHQPFYRDVAARLQLWLAMDAGDHGWDIEQLDALPEADEPEPVCCPVGDAMARGS